MLKILVATVLASQSAVSFAEKTTLVDWLSNESVERISRSQHKIDFFPLSNHFVSQPDGVVCGPTSVAIVLNSLRLGKQTELPKTHVNKLYLKHIPKKWDPSLAKYTPHNIFSRSQGAKTINQVYGEPINKKKDFGFQIRQLHKFVKSLSANSQLRVVDKNLPKKQIRKEIIKNLKTKDDYVLVNYKRKALGQKGGGHISPLGAYDKKSDSVLIMDVNPNRANWIWVELNTLIGAMATHDTTENRGYLLVSEGK